MDQTNSAPRADNTETTEKKRKRQKDDGEKSLTIPENLPELVAGNRECFGCGASLELDCDCVTEKGQGTVLQQIKRSHRKESRASFILGDLSKARALYVKTNLGTPFDLLECKSNPIFCAALSGAVCLEKDRKQSIQLLDALEKEHNVPYFGTKLPLNIFHGMKIALQSLETPDHSLSNQDPEWKEWSEQEALTENQLFHAAYAMQKGMKFPLLLFRGLPLATLTGIAMVLYNWRHLIEKKKKMKKTMV